MKRVAAALLAALWLCGGASADRDSYLADPVSGSWLGKADVLYIGDSESLGYFGDDIYRWMAARKDPRSGRRLTVWSYWTCGSDVYAWLAQARTVCGIRTCNASGHCARDHGPNDGPATVTYGPIGTYLAAVQPRVTVVSLGTNFLTVRDFKAAYGDYLARVGRLVGAVKKSGSRCIWIGPPQVGDKTRNAGAYAAFIADLKRTVEGAGGTFIDSAPFSDKKYVLGRDPEGTHYQGEGEKKWAAGVWTVLAPALDKAL
jgi:hypothetical protein